MNQNKSKVIHLESIEDFKKILEFSNLNKQKIILDFYADWCGPCKKISPLFEKLSLTSNLIFVKINIDKFNSLVEKYNISSIPTFIILESDTILDTLFGVNKNKLENLINKYDQ